MPERSRPKARDPSHQMAEVVFWPDRRLRELEDRARVYQQRGLSRQMACIQAYRAMIKERSDMPRQSER